MKNWTNSIALAALAATFTLAGCTDTTPAEERRDSLAAVEVPLDGFGAFGHSRRPEFSPS